MHRQWLLRQHNNAVSRVEKLSRDHDEMAEEGGRGGGRWRKEDADDDENEDDGIRGAA